MKDEQLVHGRRLDPAGFTLIEVVVALALLALILGVSGLAMASLRLPARSVAKGQLIAARDSALRSGRPVIAIVTLPDTGEYHVPRTSHVLFLPDGRVVGQGMDMLTGVLHASQ